jgi:hypothetical protein
LLLNTYQRLTSDLKRKEKYSSKIAKLFFIVFSLLMEGLGSGDGANTADPDPEFGAF